MSNRIDIWHGDVAASLQQAAFYRKILSDEELARADRFRFPELQQKFAQRRGILRTVLARYLDMPPKNLAFTQNAHGKPFLCQTCAGAGLQFSVSHSKDRMLIAVSFQRDLGIDVEVIREDIDEVGLAKSFFAPEDIECILNKPDHTARRKAFFDIWTGKEAYVKAIGQGLSIPLDQFSIDMESSIPALRYSIHKTNFALICEPAAWHFRKIPLAQNEAACLAYTGTPSDYQCYALSTALIA